MPGFYTSSNFTTKINVTRWKNIGVLVKICLLLFLSVKIKVNGIENIPKFTLFYCFTSSVFI